MARGKRPVTHQHRHGWNSGPWATGRRHGEEWGWWWRHNRPKQTPVKQQQQQQQQQQQRQWQQEKKNEGELPSRKTLSSPTVWQTTSQNKTTAMHTTHRTLNRLTMRRTSAWHTVKKIKKHPPHAKGKHHHGAHTQMHRRVHTHHIEIGEGAGDRPEDGASFHGFHPQPVGAHQGENGNAFVVIGTSDRPRYVTGHCRQKYNTQKTKTKTFQNFFNMPSSSQRLLFLMMAEGPNIGPIKSIHFKCVPCQRPFVKRKKIVNYINILQNYIAELQNYSYSTLSTSWLQSHSL